MLPKNEDKIRDVKINNAFFLFLFEMNFIKRVHIKNNCADNPINHK